MSVCDNCGADLWERPDDGWDRLNALLDGLEQVDRWKLRPGTMWRSQDGSWVAWTDIETLRDAVLEG